MDTVAVIQKVFCVLVVVQLIRMAVIDARTRKISHATVAMLVATWVLWNACTLIVAWPGFLDAGLILAKGLASALLMGAGTLLFTLLFERFTGNYGMGGGDIKLIAVMGLYVGVFGSLASMFIACIAFAVFALIKRKRSMNTGGPDSILPFANTGSSDVALPFGPWLALGWLVVLVCQGV